MNYRYDTRSEEQFARDIKDRTLEERRLFMLWAVQQELKTGKVVKYKDNGCGKDGRLLADSEVTTAADFSVEGIGLVEVKFAKPLLTRQFHLKVNQVKAYNKQNVTILMVNGSGEMVPEYTMIKPEALSRIMETSKVVPWQGFGGKPSYKINVNEFIWKPLI